jgi:hypothetical protein
MIATRERIGSMRCETSIDRRRARRSCTTND